MYGYKQNKNKLGWIDYRLTDYRDIERWWELIFSAYLMINLQTLSWRRWSRRPRESDQRLVKPSRPK